MVTTAQEQLNKVYGKYDINQAIKHLDNNSDNSNALDVLLDNYYRLKELVSILSRGNKDLNRKLQKIKNISNILIDKKHYPKLSKDYITGFNDKAIFIQDKLDEILKDKVRCHCCLGLIDKEDMYNDKWCLWCKDKVKDFNKYRDGTLKK